MNGAEVAKKALHWAEEFAIGYANSLLADFTNTAIFGKGKKDDEGSKEQFAKISQLIEEGKLDEAKALVSSVEGKMFGIGSNDEEIMIQDLTEIVRLELVDYKQLMKLARYFASLSPEVRRHIRRGHVAETNPEIRQNKLVGLATATTNAERQVLLQAAGFLDESEFQRLLGWDEKNFGKSAKAAERKFKRTMKQISARRGAPKQRSGLLYWLNPFA